MERGITLLRDHAARCRVLAEGATDCLAADLLTMAADLDRKADEEEERFFPRIVVDGPEVAWRALHGSYCRRGKARQEREPDAPAG